MKTKNKKKLGKITLLGIDCVDIKRLILASEICQEKFDFAEVKLLTSLPSKHKDVVPIKPILSTEQYSKFIIEDLYKYIDTEYVLIIQYDGFILNPDSWSDDFLKYDYIGAPWFVAGWSVKNFDFPKNLVGKLVVGNGGFCLRSKKFLSVCSKLFKEDKIKRYHPEDVSLCVWNRELLENEGINFAPVEIAKNFSFEAENDEYNKWDGQFGFHGFRWTDISVWSKKHPEYKIDMDRSTIEKA